MEDSKNVFFMKSMRLTLPDFNTVSSLSRTATQSNETVSRSRSRLRWQRVDMKFGLGSAVSANLGPKTVSEPNSNTPERPSDGTDACRSDLGQCGCATDERADMARTVCVSVDLVMYTTTVCDNESECVSVDHAAVCVSGKHRNADSLCVCDDGYRCAASGDRCIEARPLSNVTCNSDQDCDSKQGVSDCVYAYGFPADDSRRVCMVGVEAGRTTPKGQVTTSQNEDTSTTTYSDNKPTGESGVSPDRVWLVAGGAGGGGCRLRCRSCQPRLPPTGSVTSYKLH